jgi:hypothetical protein
MASEWQEVREVSRPFHDGLVALFLMRPIGFSTGALAKTDFRRALGELRKRHIDVVELSALPSLDLQQFSFVSPHAPSRFAQELETWVVEHLSSVVQLGIPVIVHPDTIYTAFSLMCK